MGLLKAGLEATKSVLADQWREYFYCDSLSENILAAKGQKRQGKNSSNTKGSDNIISNGSIIAVNEGQAMMIVEQGAIVEFCAEAGEFVWDKSTEPSIFYGGFGAGLKQSWETLKKRFTTGGDTAKDQRVYYFNTKEIIGNKYGTANPVPFLVVDKNIGLYLEVNVKCFGEYSYHICDPMLFYKNLCGNVEGSYDRSRIDSQLKTELLTALQPAFGALSEKGIRYSALPAHTVEMADALNEALSAKWRNLRGIEVVSVGVASIVANEEDEKNIKEMQKAAMLGNAKTAAGYMTQAAASAMNTAAGNEGGAMMGFMGMNMAQSVSGINTGNLFQMAQQQEAAQAPAGWTCSCGATGNTGNFCAACGAKKPAPKAEGWTCSCGAVNTGKFCAQCGAKQPADGWTCSCGAVNKGKFCAECGAKKPSAALLYKCDKCGWEPEDPANPPKFCPECGDPFNEEDIQG